MFCNYVLFSPLLYPLSLVHCFPPLQRCVRQYGKTATRNHSSPALTYLPLRATHPPNHHHHVPLDTLHCRILPRVPLSGGPECSVGLGVCLGDPVPLHTLPGGLCRGSEGGPPQCVLQGDLFSVGMQAAQPGKRGPGKARVPMHPSGTEHKVENGVQGGNNNRGKGGWL